MEYEKCCFVVMPFGKKPVGRTCERLMGFSPWPLVWRDRVVDFDHIYETVFEPAINAVKLPDGSQLSARRTDQEFVTGSISQDMFLYLEYSRIVLADISGLNANVFYELGHRHRARPSGTAIFRQVDAPIPFDINQIKAFPYEYEPMQAAAKSRQVISKVLTNSIRDQSKKIKILETARSTSGRVSPRDIVIETDGKSINREGILYNARRLAPKFK